MNTATANPDHDMAYPQHAAPVGVQILSMIFFIAFAIVSTALAFSWFWPAGFVLAVIFALRGFGPFQGQSRSMRPHERANTNGSLGRDTPPVLQTSGNSSFDAYRSDMLARLESEHHSFQAFLVRLRQARDKTEFDNFMDDRARKIAVDTTQDLGVQGQSAA